MNVSEIKKSRCSEASVLHKKGCLIPFTTIQLEEKEGAGSPAPKNLNTS